MTSYLGNAAPNAPSITLNPGPTFRDDFSVTGTGNINGRTGWGVGWLSGQSAQANALTVSSGKAGGTTGIGMFGFTATSTALAVCKRRMAIGVIPSQSMIDHATYSNPGVSGFVFDLVNATGSKFLNALIIYRKYVNGTVSTIISAVAGRGQPGDNIRTVYRQVGADTLVDIFHNGWNALTGAVLTAQGITYSGQFGIKGNIGAGALDDIEVAAPATQDWIDMRWGSRVQARNSDGSLTINVETVYNLSAPETLVYTIFDLNSGSEVALTGHNSVRVPVTASSGSARFTVNVAAALLSTGGPYVMRVVRDRMLAGGQSVGWSPQWRPGIVLLSGGQSLNIGILSTTFTTTDSYTPPANAFHVNGVPQNVSTLGAESLRYQSPVDTNTPPAAVQLALSAGGYAVATAGGGVSATNIATRGVGTASHNALKETLDRHNRRANFISWMDGQSDIGDTTTAYVASLLAISQDLETHCGYIVPILINPVAASWRGSNFHDIRWQLMRQTQWKVCQDYPTRFIYGAHALDIQHDTGSNGILHPSANGYGVLGTRVGKMTQYRLGLIAFDPNGPSLASVSKVSSSELRCVFNLNGWDSITLANTGYASDFNGGLLFSDTPNLTSTTVASNIRAIGATVDASPTGTQQGINVTFTGTPWTGSAFVRAMWGMNPVNPADNGTTTDPVNLDLAGKASMVQGVKSGEANTALQPYFTADNLNYITVS